MKSINQFFLCLSVLCLGLSCAQNQSSDCSVCEQLSQQQAQAWNSNDADLLKPTLHADHQNIYAGNTIKGADTQLESIKNIFSAHSKLKTKMEVSFCDKDHCAVNWTTNGHDNKLDLDWTLTGQAFWTLKDGLIIKDKGENDMLGAYARNGFTLQPPNTELEEVQTDNQDE